MHFTAWNKIENWRNSENEDNEMNCDKDWLKRSRLNETSSIDGNSNIDKKHNFRAMLRATKYYD